ncbi:hypothetical protein PGT21_008747 [Puccinia graminis f. sp. tritici]|uniref:Uncharacterized protein n=1 Tax=Puccinia graminis f. sp. tritici TaxID=56615 RepID=A0A5B0P9P1_PUCGR|nr:hypothetical protein PGT21_008747 [Puccinia graminis f. sp. tritici]KAA1134143.1 hypothetical protein PGTUg99_029651 [Puccinia graminis f. sp. tritici]
MALRGAEAAKRALHLVKAVVVASRLCARASRERHTPSVRFYSNQSRRYIIQHGSAKRDRDTRPKKKAHQAKRVLE